MLYINETVWFSCDVLHVPHWWGWSESTLWFILNRMVSKCAALVRVINIYIYTQLYSQKDLVYDTSTFGLSHDFFSILDQGLQRILIFTLQPAKNTQRWASLSLLWSSIDRQSTDVKDKTQRKGQKMTQWEEFKCIVKQTWGQWGFLQCNSSVMMNTSSSHVTPLVKYYLLSFKAKNSSWAQV